MQPINIITEPIQIKDIVECSIDKMVNEHFQAVVTGYIRLEDHDESYFNRILDTTFIIKASTEQQEVTLFRGMIRDIRVHNVDGLTRISICAQSKTAKLDLKQCTRTYQGKSQTYREIMDAVLSFHENTAVIQSKGKSTRTEGLVVQYEETDWQFLKRMASQLNTVLVADCTNDHICFYFGSPEKKGDTSLDTGDYQMRRYLDLKQGESVEYLYKSREIKNLCERVQVKGRSYYVYQIKSRMENQELEFEYTLRPASGFEVQETFNRNLTGISIMGKVTDVSDTRVRIKLFSEADFDFGKSIWFPYSTIYSSSDGTGWYCMPEKKDRVRLYIPDKREQSAYVISAVHLENDSDLRKDVDEKSIRTKYQKEIRLTPDKILITNHKGISIILDDEEGITIESNRKIKIASEHGVEINGETIQIEGHAGVLLIEGSNMLMVRDGIKEQGMNIEHR